MDCGLIKSLPQQTELVQWYRFFSLEFKTATTAAATETTEGYYVTFTV